MSVVISMAMLSGCNSKPKADLVVYGKIYTAESNQIVEAFAVLDCPVTEIHEAKPTATYFEGKKVFPNTK